MPIIEIGENPNCDPVDTRVFHELGPPQPVAQIRLEREPGRPAWYDVTGWTAAGAPCPAHAQKVDDSGEGVAWLVHGGDAGLRLRPADAPAPWALQASHQWGESFIIVAEADELRPRPTAEAS